jgi:hypothetical protein
MKQSKWKTSHSRTFSRTGQKKDVLYFNANLFHSYYLLFSIHIFFSFHFLLVTLIISISCCDIYWHGLDTCPISRWVFYWAASSDKIFGKFIFLLIGDFKCNKLLNNHTDSIVKFIHRKFLNIASFLN